MILHRAILLASLCLILPGLSSGQPAPLVFHLAPDGIDANSGESPQSAVHSLERAQVLMRAALPAQDRDVELRIAPGIYEKQQVRWTFTMPEHEIRFLPPEGVRERPVFDGAGDGGVWFTLEHSAGERTNLVWHRLEIRNYIRALFLKGEREDPARSNRGNVISDCVFRRIGNVSVPEQPPSTAAVGLLNSDDNLIAGNLFIDILNDEGCHLLHAIYAAHNSERNLIRHNIFENNCGDAVRLRDYSNENLIEGNLFLRAGMEAAYSDWYCDHDVEPRCTKRGPECPSWNNIFRGNVLGGCWDGAELKIVRLWGAESTTGCEPPGPDAQRVRASGNVRRGPPPR